MYKLGEYNNVLIPLVHLAQSIFATTRDISDWTSAADFCALTLPGWTTDSKQTQLVHQIKPSHQQSKELLYHEYELFNIFSISIDVSIMINSGACTHQR
jgi:hypothetical protein